MKKINVAVAIIFIALLFTFSCQKDNVKVNDNKKVQGNSMAIKKGGLKTTGYEGTYSLITNVGHDSKECSNSCITINGVKMHLNCQGHGNKCNLSVSINIIKEFQNEPNDPFYFGIGLDVNEPCSDSIFYMPDRSFYYQATDSLSNNIWLNIPEQVLKRDSASGQFLYNKITFTKDQLFENL